MVAESNNRRIAKNTLLLYFRMIFTMIVTLYLSRVVLNVLGESDFGVYNVIGGVVIMFTMFSGSFSSAITRYLAYEMGTGNREKLKKIFSTSVTIQVVLSLVVLVIGEVVGQWFIIHKMTIDPSRIDAAIVVLHCSLLNFCVNLLSVPYNSSIIAHEDMKAFAYISILEVLLKLGVAYLIVVFTYDKLIIYGVLLLISSIIIRVIYALYCRRYEECRFAMIIDKPLFKDMGKFVIWNSIGVTAAALRSEGVNILINLHFSPAVNAARAISFQVNTAVTQFSSNFMKAINPQITKSFASNDRNYLMELVFRSAKFSFFLLLLLTCALLIRTDFVLSLWLVQVPDHTVWFVRLMLVFTLIESVSMPLVTLMMATGNIRNYQLIVGGIILLILPVSWLLLHLGFPAESTVIVYIVVSIISLFARLIMLQKMVDLNALLFLKTIFFKCILCGVIALCISFYLSHVLPSGLLGFLTFLCMSTILCLIVILCLGLTKQEKSFVLKKISNLLKKNNT